MAGRATNMIVGRTDNTYLDVQYNESFVQAVKAITIMPDMIKRVISTVGVVKQFDKTYTPRLPGNFYGADHVFIPTSERVVLSNLRETVVALANPKTPAIHRNHFYANNPIPGCIWNNDYQNRLLLNPDDIIPGNYMNVNLAQDAEDVIGKIEFLLKKAPKYYTGTVTFDGVGDKGMLVCNEQGTLRVTDRGPGEQLNDYYSRIRLEGSQSDFDNVIAIDRIKSWRPPQGFSDTTESDSGEDGVPLPVSSSSETD